MQCQAGRYNIADLQSIATKRCSSCRDAQCDTGRARPGARLLGHGERLCGAQRVGLDVRLHFNRARVGGRRRGDLVAAEDDVRERAVHCAAHDVRQDRACTAARLGDAPILCDPCLITRQWMERSHNPKACVIYRLTAVMITKLCCTSSAQSQLCRQCAGGSGASAPDEPMSAPTVTSRSLFIMKPSAASA
jgi:hypothetical protein